MKRDDKEVAERLLTYLKNYNPEEERNIVEVAYTFGVTRSFIRRLAEYHGIELKFQVENQSTFEKAMKFNWKRKEEATRLLYNRQLKYEQGEDTSELDEEIAKFFKRPIFPLNMPNVKPYVSKQSRENQTKENEVVENGTKEKVKLEVKKREFKRNKELSSEQKDLIAKAKPLTLSELSRKTGVSFNRLRGYLQESGLHQHLLGSKIETKDGLLREKDVIVTR